MRILISLLLVGMLGIVGCDDDDVAEVVTYDPPIFLENVEFVATTNTPTVQINRFVAANNMDTVMTSSSLVYEVLDAGGSEKPNSESQITAWFKGYTTDGVIFDQSASFPLTSELSGLFACWREGVPKLGRGGKMWMLARPSLASNNNAPSNGSRVLVFEIELIDFE